MASGHTSENAQLIDKTYLLIEVLFNFLANMLKNLACINTIL